MKYPFQVIAGLFVAAIIIMFACKKYNAEGTYDVSHLNQLFSPLQDPAQELSVQAGRDTIVFGHDSTFLHFCPTSFKDAGGKVIVSGTIYLKLIEMYKHADMIVNRTSATANGALLKSGGEVNITATMNGQEVFANGYSIGFRQTGASAEDMSIFIGGNGNADSSVTWAATNNTRHGTVTDTAHTTGGFGFGQGFYYLFDSCTDFKLVNCDRLVDYHGQNTSVSVIVPDNSFNPGNTQIFIILPDINCVTTSDERQGYNASTNTFVPGNHDNRIPVGAKYDIVVIANKNGTFYYFEKSGTVTDGLTINALMAVETSYDIKARLKAL